MDTNKKFRNLIEAAQYFSDESKCREHLATIRWGNKPKCVYCNHDKVYKFKDNKNYKCAKCRKRFTVTTNSVFHNTNISLSKWFLGSWLFINHKKGISSHQLARDLSLTQKSAWYLLHRLREMLKETISTQLDGVIETDETYVGGHAINWHHEKRKKMREAGTGYIHKTPVVGFLQRGGQVRTVTLKDAYSANGEVIKPLVKANVKPGSVLMTDQFGAYYGLYVIYQHEVLNKTQGEYLRGEFHTQNIESFWSWLKRTIIGTYHQVSRKHLSSYCEETSFKYNTRKIKDCERFDVALGQCNNKVLTYETLIAKK